jgi:hypothetical protein
MLRLRTILVGMLLLGATPVIGVTLCTINHSLSTEGKKVEERTSQQVSETQAITFTETIGGKGTTRDGAPYSTHVYKSSDGIVVSVIRENQDSASKAGKALQRKIKQANKILEESPKLDEKGQRIGKRVVAMFAPDDSLNKQASVIWTDGQQLYYIKSSSLKHALEFEKQFYNK